MFFVYLYIFFLYVRPQDWVPFFLGVPTALLVTPPALLIGVMQYQKNPKAYVLPQSKLLLIYLLIIFISTFLAVDFSFAADQFVTFLKRVVVFFMIIWNVNSKEKFSKVIIGVLVFSAFLSFQAILQAHTGESWGGLTVYPGYEEIRVRWYGDWDGPNVYAILFIIASAITIEIILGKTSMAKRILGASIILPFFAAIYYTNSRGAILALLCCFVFYFRSHIKNPKIMAAGVLLFVLIFVALPSRMTEVSSGESSAHERTWLWEQGLTMLRENPVFGVGRGEFAKHTSLKLKAHNNYVENFSELGFSGFFCFMGVLYFTFLGNLKSSVENEGLYENVVSYNKMMNNVLVVYCSATFFVVMELDIFYFIIGLASSAYLIARNESEEIQDLTLSFRNLSIIVLSMIFIIVMVWLAAVKEIL